MLLEHADTVCNIIFMIRTTCQNKRKLVNVHAFILTNTTNLSDIQDTGIFFSLVKFASKS